MSARSVISNLVSRRTKRFIKGFSSRSRLVRRLSSHLPDALCVDVGASYYPHNPWRLFLASPQTQWIAVEPNEENLGYVKQWDWPSHVRTVTMGLSRDGGLQTLYKTNVDSGSSLLPPVISPSMALRVTNLDYFFPVEEKLIDTLTLKEVIERADGNAPVFVKLDTQGTELSILMGAESLLKSHRIMGIEMESTLLAQPVMQGSGKLWEACRYLEELGFEMRRIKPIHAPSRLGLRNPRGLTYLNECDAVFSVRPDIAAGMPTDHRLALMAFGLANDFFEDALATLEHDAELRALLESRGCDISGLRASIRALA